MAQSKKLIVICGPTATGKTKLGVALAKALDGEVVSADSMQVYRGMPIGTAQPTAEERDGVPHHMMAMADPSENYSVARYVEEATACVEDIFARGKQPILVGGTGLYIDALCKGQTFSDFQPDSGLRAKLQAQAAQGGLPRLWVDLERIDPEAAARLHPNDEKRILRALEVWYTTGKTISQHNRETQAVPPRYEALTITLTYADRQALYARIDQRVDEMMKHGLVKEIQALLAAGIPKDGTAMQAIGYKELVPAVASGDADAIQQAAEEVKLRSRQYAKRQLSWFRRNPKAHWIEVDRQGNISSIIRDSTDFLHENGVGSTHHKEKECVYYATDTDRSTTQKAQLTGHPALQAAAQPDGRHRLFSQRLPDPGRDPWL